MRIRNIYLVLLITFVVATSLLGCGRPVNMLQNKKSESINFDKSERQQIVDYFQKMEDVLEAHADFYDDMAKVADMKNPTKNEAISRLTDLLNRMEDIYMDVETSIPPPVLRSFKAKWSEECHLCIKALALTIQGIEEDDINKVIEGDDYIYEANKVKTELQNELLDLLDKYNIDINNLY